MTQKITPSTSDVPLSDNQMETLSGGGYSPRHMGPEAREFAGKITNVVTWPFRKVGSFVSGLFN